MSHFKPQLSIILYERFALSKFHYAYIMHQLACFFLRQSYPTERIHMNPDFSVRLLHFIVTDNELTLLQCNADDAFFH